MIRRLLPVLPLLAAVLLGGCASDVPARLDGAAAIARGGGLSATRMAGGAFTLAVFHRVADPAAPLTVYIEGDGAAWESRRRLSADPTPREATGLRLAAADPGPNVVYIGRPCQYGGATHDAACHPRYWSSHRFAPEVIAATGAVLDAALARFGGRGVDLVGYSGGGAIAALLAARRSDVHSLRTVAGTLDHAAVSRLHGVTPLGGSLNPMDEVRRLRGLPQVHFSGAADTIVPPAIAAAFATAAGPCARAVTVPGADHGDGWASRWPRLLAEAPRCP